MTQARGTRPITGPGATAPVEPGRAVVVDIDGVLSDAATRQHYLEAPRRDWQAFFEACGDDPVIEEITVLLDLLEPGMRVVLLTARPGPGPPPHRGVARRYKIRWDLLIMRPWGDYDLSRDFKQSTVWDLRDYGFDLLPRHRGRPSQRRDAPLRGHPLHLLPLRLLRLRSRRWRCPGRGGDVARDHGRRTAPRSRRSRSRRSRPSTSTACVESLAEAAATPDACPWYRAVYADETPVGFVMLSDGIPVERTQYLGPYYLWRLLIDARVPGPRLRPRRARPRRRYVRTRPGAEQLLTSYVPGPAVAGRLLPGYGFTPDRRGRRTASPSSPCPSTDRTPADGRSRAGHPAPSSEGRDGQSARGVPIRSRFPSGSVR